MNVIVLIVLCGIAAPTDWTPVIAAEGAVVTIEMPALTVAPQPAPDSGTSVGQPTMNRVLNVDARKTTANVPLSPPPIPGPTAAPQTVCTGGVCRYMPPVAKPAPARPPVPVPVSPQPPGNSNPAVPVPAYRIETAPVLTRQACPSGVCRPRLLWRWRR